MGKVNKKRIVNVHGKKSMAEFGQYDRNILVFLFAIILR